MGNISIPDGLSREARKMYRRACAKYGSHRPADFMTELVTLCRTLDRLRSAEAILQRDGAVLYESGKPLSHPAAARIDAETKAFERQMRSVREWVGDRAIARFTRVATARILALGAAWRNSGSILRRWRMDDEATELLRKLVTETNTTLQSHAATMARLSENLIAANKVVANHGDCIRITQENLQGLTDLVNAQTKGFNVLREIVLKLHTHCFGPDESPEAPDVVN